MNLIKFFILCLFSGFSMICHAQEDPVIAKSKNTFVNELRENEPRPKFFEFTYRAVRGVDVSSKSDIFGRENNEIRHNPRFTLKLRAPIILKEKFNLIGGFKMRQEFFDFENDPTESGEHFRTLDRRYLQNLGVSVFMKKELSENKFLYGFWNGSLNADDISLDDFIDQFRTSVTVVYVKNTNELTQIGFGGAFGYIFGDARIFPVFVYNQTFSRRWNLDAMLPKSVKLRYTHKAEMHSYLIADLNGASYFLRKPTVAGFDKLTFQRSAVNIKFRLEKEIYDWLWFGVDAGYNIPINLFLSEPRDRRDDAIVTYRASATPIIGISIFAVVPKKIYFKKAKEGG